MINKFFFLFLVAILSIFVPMQSWAQAIGATCTAGQEGNSACNVNGCFVCKSTLWTPQALILGSTTSPCDTAHAGLLQFSGASMSYCNGSSWMVLATAAGCTSDIGSVCADGTIYAGISPDGSVPMYVMPCDLGLSGTKGNCATGARNAYKWGTNGVRTGYASSFTTGRANTDNLIANYGSYNDGYVIGVPPAQACKNQTYGGHSDWYLPARDELNVLYTNQVAVGGAFLTDGSYYWASTEYTIYYAGAVRFSDGSQPVNLGKQFSSYVRCVRR